MANLSNTGIFVFVYVEHSFSVENYYSHLMNVWEKIKNKYQQGRYRILDINFVELDLLRLGDLDHLRGTTLVCPYMIYYFDNGLSAKTGTASSSFIVTGATMNELNISQFIDQHLIDFT